MMRRVLVSAAIFVVQQTMVGCAAPALDDRSPAETFEADMGGPGGVLDFLTNSSDEDIAATMAEYGISYEAHDLSESEKQISSCPMFFPAGDRNRLHSFDGEFYIIDGSGRPARAISLLPPIVAAPRQETCQRNVGRWGDAENPSNDYDGGHLIAASLGGFGGRANLVPQDSNFNQVNYNQIEQRVARCAALSNGRIQYDITVFYPNASALIPSLFRMFILDRVQGDSVTLFFNNVDNGGSNGTNERNRAFNFLSANGCN